jgi:chemotaxis signal transduction protein
MRVFLCAFGSFSLAVPMKSVSSITLYEGGARKAVEHKKENGNTYVALPLLFNLPQATIKHGIILKNRENEDTQDNSVIENKTILLATEIEREIEIPEKNIYPVPKTLKVMRFSNIFSGIAFYSYTGRAEEELILMLKPEKLVKNIKRKLKA